jgi:hypothetical protein
MGRSLCSGVALQSASSMVSLNYLTAVSISSSVLSGAFRDSFSFTKCRKAFQFVYLLSTAVSLGFALA